MSRINTASHMLSTRAAGVAKHLSWCTYYICSPQGVADAWPCCAYSHGRPYGQGAPLNARSHASRLSSVLNEVPPPPPLAVRAGAALRTASAGAAMPAPSAAGAGVASCGGGCTGGPRALPGRKHIVRWFVGRRHLTSTIASGSGEVAWRQAAAVTVVYTLSFPNLRALVKVTC